MPQGEQPLEEPACPHLTSPFLPPGRGECKDLWLEPPPNLGCSVTATEVTHTKNIKAILGAPQNLCFYFQY